MRILIADDEAMNRELLRAMLEQHGHEVEEAADGEDAVDKIAHGRPAVVLMDIRMPRMDGFSALSKLRANPATSSIPVVAVTAFAMDADRQRIENAGFDAYISKPITFNIVEAVLAKVCRQ